MNWWTGTSSLTVSGDGGGWGGGGRLFKNGGHDDGIQGKLRNARPAPKGGAGVGVKASRSAFPASYLPCRPRT